VLRQEARKSRQKVIINARENLGLTHHSLPACLKIGKNAGCQRWKIFRIWLKLRKKAKNFS
jgi:hypothetical protein